MHEFDYPFGIEEEYFLASAATGKLTARVPKKLLAAATSKLGDSVATELLQSQIEIVSPIFHALEEASASMVRMRRELAELVRTMGLQLIAASTHPLGLSIPLKRYQS